MSLVLKTVMFLLLCWLFAACFRLLFKLAENFFDTAEKVRTTRQSLEARPAAEEPVEMDKKAA